MASRTQGQASGRRAPSHTPADGWTVGAVRLRRSVQDARRCLYICVQVSSNSRIPEVALGPSWTWGFQHAPSGLHFSRWRRWDPGAALGSALAVASQPSAVPGARETCGHLQGSAGWSPGIQDQDQASPELLNSLV